MQVPTSVLTPAIVEHDPFTDPERFALAGFLAGYSGLTHEAYALDLRQYATYCADHHLALFDVKRAHIEAFARQLEAAGRARATIARRLCTITCFYRYAEQEGLIPISPAVHVRRPRLDYESHATGLDRNEVGAMLVAAGLGDPRDHALLSLLALNGLRVSEATGADIEQLGLERGHRTLRIVRKGGKIVIVPLAPRTARAVDLAVGERTEGPIFCGNDHGRLERHAAARIVRRIARKAGITKRVGPHTLRHASSPPHSTPASPSETSKKPQVTRIRVPPCATTAPASASTATRPTSSRRSSLAQPVNPNPPNNTPALVRRSVPERALCARDGPVDVRSP